MVWVCFFVIFVVIGMLLWDDELVVLCECLLEDMVVDFVCLFYGCLLSLIDNIVVLYWVRSCGRSIVALVEALLMDFVESVCRFVELLDVCW